MWGHTVNKAKVDPFSAPDSERFSQRRGIELNHWSTVD